MRAIGFTGEARHGKDTAANLLADYLRGQGQTVRVTAWANKLKVSAARALGERGSDEQLIAFCDRLKEEGMIQVSFRRQGPHRPGDGYGRTELVPFSGRQFLEWLGTEGGREVHGQNVWVDLALPPSQYDTIDGGRGYAGSGRRGSAGIDWHIDTTTRFDSEVERIREYKGWIVRVERPSVDNGLKPGDHVSRAGIPREQCDAVIINDAGLPELRSAVVEAHAALLTGAKHYVVYASETLEAAEEARR